MSAPPALGPADSSRLARDETTYRTAVARDFDGAWLRQVLVPRRWTILAAAFGTALLAGITSLVSARQYVSTASFVVQSNRTVPALAGLAAQMGVTLPNVDQSLNPSVYADLLRSDQILEQLIERRFLLTSGKSTSLPEVFHTADATANLRRFRTLREVRSRLAAGADPRTGVISLEFASPDPGLSQTVVATLLELLARFNLEQRQSQAHAERVFSQNRAAQAQRELRASEDGLLAFLQQNRAFANSPLLAFEHDRLARDVRTKQDLYDNLTQAYERARIEEVRDLPAITVLERPTTPLVPRGRGTIGRTLLGFTLGLLLSVVVIVAAQGMKTLRLARALPLGPAS